MRNSLVVVAFLALTACYPADILQYDRPDARAVLKHVRAGEALRAELADGGTVELEGAVTAGALICSARLQPACFPAAFVTRLETREVRDSPGWAYAAAAPFVPVFAIGVAAEGLERALTGGPQTFSPSWAADALPEYNPCIRHVRREPDGAWPSDQHIRADLHRRRATLGGACLMRLGAEYAFPVSERRRLHLTGMVRQRFEAVACVRPRPEAAAPAALVPIGGLHTEGREVNWPGELAVILQDPDVFAVTPDLADGCTGAGGVAPDLSAAMARTREGWPLPTG
jgi:hypothetical protein